jgi:DNA polymerase-1
VTILTGDRDSFQLIDEHIKVRIPHTVQGKTETEDYTVEKIIEKYGLSPKSLIEVKGLAGDSSDNIPGIPGVGEKTAINLIKDYKDIEGIYKHIDNLKGKLKEKIKQNEEMAYLSRTLGTIDTKVPIDKKVDNMKVTKWDNEKVTDLFTKLKFNRFIERFGLEKESLNKTQEINIEGQEITEEQFEKYKQEVKKCKKIFYYIITEAENGTGILNTTIDGITLYSEEANTAYLLKDIQKLKNIFEDAEILKIGYKQKQDYILLKQIGINPNNLMFDIEIAGYLLNSNITKYTIEYLSEEYLNIDVATYLKKDEPQEKQLTLFETPEDNKPSKKNYVYTYLINKLYYTLTDKMKQICTLDLFNKIEMPLLEVLADMQYQGIYVDKDKLFDFGNELKNRIEELTKEIYDLAGEEFNINSPKQLGEILFEKLKLPMGKKNKKGYSTGVEILEKLKFTHPIIERILEYRQIGKLNSTYVEGLIPYINKTTKKIHSSFHQTVTATGRISSTEPNLQNIPTRNELGKNLRKVFKPEEGNIFIDADYSQIELRVLAHISNDEHMIQAFNNDEDIHTQVASKVFNIPMEEVTKEQRTKAKAVNFGIVYGISDFGLSEQLKIPRKEAKQYIEQYLEKYQGIKKFMETIVETAKKEGYVETLFHRRRYIPEINSNNYMVRQFGSRIAMNTPIQGTAADIMKLAMINIYNELNKQNLKSKIILQVHDELLIEAIPEEKEKVEQILKQKMENVITLKVPLKIDIEEGKNLYDAK